MMGHLMNLVVSFVREVKGPGAVEPLFRGAGLTPTAYRFEAIYPEDDFARLLASAVQVCGVTPAQAEVAFADYFMRVSPELFPSFFAISPDTRTFLERLPALHRMLPEAAARVTFRDKVRVEPRPAGGIVFHYDSPHRLCVLLERLLHKLLQHYGETGDVVQRLCARQGAAECVFDVTFHGRSAPRP